MEGDERAWQDASCCMLFEASGDSEIEYYDTAELGGAATTAEDDTESCSYCSLSSGGVVRDIDAGGGCDFLDADVDDRVEGGGRSEDDGGATTEVEDGVVDQCGCGKTAAAELNKSKGSEEYDIKLLSEGDTDRLFWETCLAS